MTVRTISRPILTCFLIVFLVSGCATPPKNIQNACAIFEDKSGWYDITRRTQKKWGIPVHVQLAIIHQESKFRHNAKPPRRILFWFIPGPRISTAYGFAQVLDGTWEWYRNDTGNHGADRDDFDDAVDFIGWYVNKSHKKLGISKWDARAQYLAYHEGHTGYRQKTYRAKPWLIKVSKKVGKNAARYRAQLARCRHVGGGFSFWPF